MLPSHLILLSKSHFNIPPVVTIKTVQQYHSFVKWCKLFKPSNIHTIIFNIYDNTIYRCVTIDFIPTSVHTLRVLSIDVPCYGNFSLYLAASNIHTLYLNVDTNVFTLPHTLNHLILDHHFTGAIIPFHTGKYPVEKIRELQTLVVHNYSSCYTSPLISFY